MNTMIYIAAAVLIGVTLSLQPPINAVMTRSLGNPLMAACVSISIAFFIAIMAWLSLSKGGGDMTQIKTLPWWVILSGMAGVFFVVGGVLIAPTIGVALFLVCIVAGQLMGSSVVDHIGAFGMPIKPVNSIKLVGLMLVFAGAVMVQNSSS